MRETSGVLERELFLNEDSDFGEGLLVLRLAEWQAEQCHGKGCVYP